MPWSPQPQPQPQYQPQYQPWQSLPMRQPRRQWNTRPAQRQPRSFNTRPWQQPQQPWGSLPMPLPQSGLPRSMEPQVEDVGAEVPRYGSVGMDLPPNNVEVVPGQVCLASLDLLHAPSPGPHDASCRPARHALW